MRPYRGLTKEGNWVYGWLFYTIPSRPYIIEPHNEIVALMFPNVGGITISPVHIRKVIPETVGQYTGHNNCYEGDIVSNGDNYPSVIEWQCNPDQDEFIGFYLHEIYPKGEPDRFHSFFAYTTPLKVIGNIHQNPKLIEGKEDE